MKHYLSKIIKKSGMPPGTAVHIGVDSSAPIGISEVFYNPQEASYRELKESRGVSILKGAERVQWVDIRGIHDTQSIKDIGNTFHLHPLVVEDISNTSQLPKIESQEKSFFVIIKAISFDGETINLEHICLFLTENYIVSFQEKTSDTFKVVRERILNKKGKIIEKQADYLLYSLLDYVIDTYFEALQKIDKRISDIGDDIESATPAQSTLKNIQTLKKQILLLKRYFWYTRDIILSLKKSDSPLIADKTEKYFTDLNDHIAHIIDISESFREELIDLSERHLSAINLRSNDIMKMLTIVAAIFMPLTFIAGIYGMNFVHMPELKWMWSYPILISIMIILTCGLLWLFKRNQWFD